MCTLYLGYKLNSIQKDIYKYTIIKTIVNRKKKGRNRTKRWIRENIWKIHTNNKFIFISYWVINLSQQIISINCQQVNNKVRIQCTRIIQILNKHYHERDKIKRWERKWDTRNINRNKKKRIKLERWIKIKQVYKWHKNTKVNEW